MLREAPRQGDGCAVHRTSSQPRQRHRTATCAERAERDVREKGCATRARESLAARPSQGDSA